MKTLGLLCLWAMLACPILAQTPAFVQKQIPDAWITKLKKFDFKSSPNELVKEFETVIAPNQISPFEKEALLNPTFVNVDEDGQDEVLLLVGGENLPWKYDHNLCIIKQINNKWTLIHSEPLKHTSPTLHIVSKLSPYKVFYVTQKGDGILGPYSGWREDVRLYKLIDNKVHLCLTVLDGLDYHITPWLTHQEVSTTIHIAEGSIWVAYHYNYLFRLAQENYGLTSLLHGRAIVEYVWDKEQKQYLPKFTNEVTTEKLASLEGKADFQKPFQKELEEILVSGSDLQKNAYRQYLEERNKGK